MNVLDEVVGKRDEGSGSSETDWTSASSDHLEAPESVSCPADAHVEPEGYGVEPPILGFDDDSEEGPETSLPEEQHTPEANLMATPSFRYNEVLPKATGPSQTYNDRREDKLQERSARARTRYGEDKHPVKWESKSVDSESSDDSYEEFKEKCVERRHIPATGGGLDKYVVPTDKGKKAVDGEAKSTKSGASRRTVRSVSDRLTEKMVKFDMNQEEIEMEADQNARRVYAKMVRNQATEIISNRRLIAKKQTRQFQVDVDRDSMKRLSRVELKQLNREMEEELASVTDQLHQVNADIQMLSKKRKQLLRDKERKERRR